MSLTSTVSNTPVDKLPTSEQNLKSNQKKETASIEQMSKAESLFQGYQTLSLADKKIKRINGKRADIVFLKKIMNAKTIEEINQLEKERDFTEIKSESSSCK